MTFFKPSMSISALGSSAARPRTSPATADFAVASGNGDTGTAHLLALRPFVPQPVLHWTLDQAAWNGTAGEVVDLSGNGLHGTSFLGANTANTTPAIPGSPGTCRYGAFDGVDDYVEVADNALLDVTDELTVMMWLRPTAYPTGGNSAVVLNAELRFPSPIFAQRMRLGLFVDAGQVWERGEQLPVVRGLRVTPGLGLRFTTPLGPVRIDAAYNGYAAEPGPLYFQNNADNSLTLRLNPDSTVVTYQPVRPSSFWRRLVVQFALGQAF